MKFGRFLVALVLLLLGGQSLLAGTATAAGPCEPPSNEIVCENSKEGNPPSEWDVEGDGDPSIQGFTTDISVNRGQTVHFKIDTSSTAYRLDIYRMGYYGGLGARKVATVNPSVKLPQLQPSCETESSTGLVDCGNWAESAFWNVPANAVSGIYFAHLVRTDKTSEGSQIVFIVRNDEGHSKLLFQTADTTWEAYNRYGGHSLYTGGPGTNPERAYKVSYNRPLQTRGTTPEDSPFSAEYPMVRWLERNGYDVSYFTGVDADRRGSEILEHKVYLSVGHDEYWSGQQRANVEAAREAGVNLAFFSGNEVFWKTRWENSIDGSNTDHRTLVCYKETHANAKIDPKSTVWTGTWRDPRFSPPADGGRPENALSGQMFMVNSGTSSIEVPAEYSKMRLWRNTSVASLAPGETASLGTETLGYEWDEDILNSSRPPGLIDLSSTTFEVPDHLVDYGSNYLPGMATHHLTLYRAPSGALVFGAGTVQWSWGLDTEHDRGAFPREADPNMQQATANLLADMGAQAETLEEGLVAPSQSTDVTPPVTTITSPAEGAHLESGTPITVTGASSDAKGQVAAVEVSIDGGASWHPAEGRGTWKYKWTPGKAGAASVMARATDDSANLEKPGDENKVEITARTCPCSIWDSSVTAPGESDPSEIELGVKFRADAPGLITGLRYYKPPGSTGTHIGRLWTANGVQLAEAAFTNETASGWQQVNLASPVPISADTTYVASYFAPNGNYAAINDYFALVGADSSPLHALADGVDGPNGVFSYGPSGDLFSGGGPESFRSTNYLADVVYKDEKAPPAISNVQVNAENDGTATVTWTTDIASDSKVDYGTGSASLNLNVSSGALVTSHSVQLTGLSANTTYFFRVTSADSEGSARTEPNTLLTPLSFLTPPPPPSLNSTVPVSPANQNSPKVVGTAVAGTTVRLYSGGVCSGSPIATVSAAELEAGAAFSVADNSSTVLRATATSPGTKSSICSSSITYVEDSAAPQTALTSQPPALAKAPTAKFEFSGEDPGGSGVASFECRRDSTEASAWQSCSSPKEYASLTDGAHKFEVRAKDQAGNVDASPSIFAWTVDTTAPETQILSDPAAVTAATSAEFTFSGSDGSGSGVASFECRRDSTEASAWQACTSPKEYALLSDGAHKFEVRAVDLAGNADASPATFSWTVDTVAPQVQIESGPAALSTVANATFAFTGSDPGGSGVAFFECRRDSSLSTDWGPCTSTKSYNALAEGAHKFELRAVDHAGNVTPSPTSYNWSIDTTAPQTQIGSGPSALTASPTAKFTFSGSDTGGSGVASFECRRDSAEASAWAACASPKEYAALGDGAHKFEVRAKDQAGNLDATPATFEWSVDTTAPQTQIDSSPSALSSSASAKFTFSGSDTGGSGVASFECRRDSTEASAWQVCASPKEYASLGDGAHKFEVRAKDQAGNPDATPATFEWSVDTTAPQTQVDSSPAALTTSTTATFAFSGSDTGGSGVASYQCRIDSAQVVDWTACASPKSYTGLPDGSHTFEVRAIDQAGNADQSPTSFSWAVDTTAPQTQIDSHPTSLSPSATAQFTFSGSDTGGSGVASFECRRDSAEASAWQACASPKEYAALADGAHKLEVRAIDKAGNTDQSPATFSWTIDATAPQTQIDSGPTALTASATTRFTFSGSDGTGSGVASYQCRVDSIETSAWAACASPKEYAALADGAHKFEVRAIDQAGNADATPATFSWTIDSTAPQTQIDGHPSVLSASATAQFAFSGSDTGGSGVASFECRRDSAEASAWQPCASPKEYASLTDGAHKFEVRAIDKAGNVDVTPATFEWSVDTTAPSTQIQSSPAALTASAKAEFTFSGSDGTGSGVASYQCRRDSTEAAAWQPCTSPKAVEGLADGAHKFEVRAIDQAGNTDATPATFEWSVDTTAPQTQIDSSPSALIASASAKFTFSGSDTGGSGIASFECRRDSAEASAWQVCASPKEYASLTDGAHKFEVRAKDQAGNLDATPATFEWSVDATAPQTQIDSSPSALTASPTAKFTFSGSDTGGSGVASFECRRDSAEASGWAACASPKEYAALGDGAHKFEVRAKDQAGNLDATPATFEWSVDTSAPQTQIDSSPSALSSSASAKFTFSGSDTGGSGVASFECRRDSAEASAWQVCASPKEYSALADGAHKFEVRAKDQAGNTDATPATFEWSVDTTAPSTQILSSPAALTASAKAEFTFSGSDGSGSGVASFECRRDSTEASAWQVCASPKEYSALTDGAHKFEVRAKDQAGNADASPAAFSWTIDTTPPAATIDSGPTGLTNDPTPSFEFHASEGGSSFECSIDTGTAAYGPCSGAGSHTPASPLADGPYTFRVRATDAAGNQGAGATRAFTVDTSAPPPPELNSTQPASPANENSPKLIGSAPAGSTVRLYESADCSGTPLVTVSAAQLAAGIAVSVADDSTTQWSATATSSADSTSPCSAPITYVEDSTAPQSQIDSGPLGTSTSTNASFTFSGSDVGGTGVASFECRLDAALEVSWTPCVSPQSYAALLDGPHSFQVRAVDRAGNADESPATRDWNVDASEPGQLAPRSPVRLLKIVYNVRRGTASLIFEVPSAGMLSASVPTASPRKNLRRGPGTLSSAKSHQIEPTSVRATQPGTVTLQIRLGSAGRKLLRESRKVKVTLQVSFAADGESAISRMLAITLKRRVSPRTQRPTAGPPR